MSNFILFTNGVLSHRFDGELWGERKISIIDPSFVWPQIEQQNSQHNPEDPASEPTILIDDPDIEPPMIEVDNPNCRVPPEAIEVSNELLTRTINETDGVWSLVDGEIVKLPKPLPTIAELKQAKLREINADFKSAMQEITSGYPANEISSWAKQETEARAYVADNLASTPLLDALADARGLTKADLVARVIVKADLFATLSGQLIGKRQAREDAINALPALATPEDVAAITW